MTAEPPSVRVVEAVADREGVDPAELTEPLYRVIDPDALDGLFRRTDGEITFEYYGYEVTVDGAGAVEVRPAE